MFINNEKLSQFIISIGNSRLANNLIREYNNIKLKTFNRNIKLFKTPDLNLTRK